MNEQVRVNDRGVNLPLAVVDPLDVLLEGHRVWSFNPDRDGTATADDRFVPWHPALRRFLDGTAHVVVRTHVGERSLFDGEVGFGTSSGRVSVTDAAGYPLAVDKGGRMQRSFAETDGSTKHLIVEAVSRVLHDLREECGLEAFLSFGCLLGAVRNGHMIGHDSDADLSYLSAYTHPFDIIRENQRAARRMKELGWQLVRMSEADFKVWVDLADGRRCGIDVFGGFHVDGVFHMMPNVRGELDRSSLVPVSSIVLEGTEVAAPARPEDLLALTYGEGWRVPDPSFKFTPAGATTRRTNGWMRGRRNNLRHWHDFYKPGAARPPLPTEPSAFAAWVAERIEPGSRVVDVGAGNGRDAVFFARQGHPVVATEAASNAMKVIRDHASEEHVRVPRHVVNFNEVRSPVLAAAGLARAEEPSHLHARFLLDSLSTTSRQSFWRFASVAQRRGGLTFLEFRVGGHGATTYPDHFRATLHPDRLVDEITTYGGTVVEREQGRGRAVLGDEDPEVCRLVVRWGGPRRPAPARNAHTPKQRLEAVQRDLHQNRQANQRLSDLLDIITDVLVPATDPTDPRLVAALARLRELLPEG